MPSILLINENKIVSRLLQLSSKKQGYNLEELNNLGSSSTSYDVIFVDSDLYNDELLQNIVSKFTYNQLGYIGAKQDNVPAGFGISIEKPFLPTNFVTLIQEQVIDSQPKQTVSVDDNLLSTDGELDLDDETELLLSEEDIELESLEGSDELLELEEEIFDDVDLSLNSSKIMTTGVVDNMMKTDSNHEELADMVSEIDDMDNENDLGLDSLDSTEDLSNEKEEKELNLDNGDTLDELEDLLNDEELKDDSSDVEDTLDEELIDEVLEEKQDEELEQEIDTLVATGALAASAGIEEFDNLEESQMQDALGEEITKDFVEEEISQEAEVEELKDEIIEDEIVSQEIDAPADETLVESNDVEKWIRDAVSKAITPEMIKEALDGMDVNVTLSFNSKKED